MRVQQSLSGQWGFQLDPHATTGVADVRPDRTISVPMPWQAAFPELRQYSGYAWYQREFTLDEAWLEGEILLHFGAVDYWCEVFVNGQRVGEHEGGYTPFTFPVRQYARTGQNTLTLRVYDSAQEKIAIQRWFDTPAAETVTPPYEAKNVPHGKQEWYINVGGVWQDVTLTAVPALYLHNVHVTPNIHTGEVRVQVSIDGTEAPGTLQVTVAGNTVETAVLPGERVYTLTAHVPDCKWWSPETPHLYEARVTLSGDERQDTLSVRFGFREITTRDGQLLLNGEPLFLISALDQDFYPETIYTVPSEDYLRDQFRKARALGLNSLRVHIKPPDPRYYDLADEMGLLIWAEIPSWRTFHVKTTSHPSALYLSDAIKERVRQTLREMIARDYNHPSIIIWTIVNEDWGTGLFLSDADRAWVVDMVNLCKQLDPTRLVVDNSPCPAPWGLSTHVQSDIDDFHIYTNIPDHAEGFEGFVEQFGLRPLWSFSNFGDARRTGQEPIILSEFGNWGLPALSVLSPDGEPAWFDLGPWWSGWDGEPGYPQGVAQRFQRLGLGSIWNDYDAFAEATQWHQFYAMKFEIEAMRRQPGIAGYVITELADTYWESNGLLDFNRCPKVYHQRLPRFNTPDVVVAQLQRFAYWDDETAHAQVHVSRYGAAEWADAQLRVTGQEQRPIPPLPRGAVRSLGWRQWSLPSADTVKTHRLQLEVVDASSGALLAENDTELLILPSTMRQAACNDPITVISRLGRAALAEIGADNVAMTAGEPEAVPGDEWLETSANGRSPVLSYSMRQLGYRVVGGLTADTRVLVTDHPDSDMLEWVRAGGDMLYLSQAHGPFFWRQHRHGSYSGNWITSFSWLRPGVYKRLPQSNPLSLPFIGMMPEGVFVGLPVDDERYHQDFLAGQITGWVGHPAIHTVQFRYGKGRVIATTYRLEENLTRHPLATAMFHDLIDYLVSDACRPNLTANF